MMKPIELTRETTPANDGNADMHKLIVVNAMTNDLAEEVRSVDDPGRFVQVEMSGEDTLAEMTPSEANIETDSYSRDAKKKDAAMDKIMQADLNLSSLN